MTNPRRGCRHRIKLHGPGAGGGSSGSVGGDIRSDVRKRHDSPERAPVAFRDLVDMNPNVGRASQPVAAVDLDQQIVHPRHHQLPLDVVETQCDRKRLIIPLIHQTCRKPMPDSVFCGCTGQGRSVTVSLNGTVRDYAHRESLILRISPKWWTPSCIAWRTSHSAVRSSPGSRLAVRSQSSPLLRATSSQNPAVAEASSSMTASTSHSL